MFIVTLGPNETPNSLAWVEAGIDHERIFNVKMHFF